MSNPEAILQRQILLAVSRCRWRWFANPRGHAIVIADGRIAQALAFLHSGGFPAFRKVFGVGPNGASDLLGIETVTVLPEHVGQVWARAAIAEIKTPSGRLRTNQTLFARVAKRLGCRVFAWRSVQQAREECE